MEPIGESEMAPHLAESSISFTVTFSFLFFTDWPMAMTVKCEPPTGQRFTPMAVSK